jgi:hypothetical protein
MFRSHARIMRLSVCDFSFHRWDLLYVWNACSFPPHTATSWLPSGRILLQFNVELCSVYSVEWISCGLNDRGIVVRCPAGPDLNLISRWFIYLKMIINWMPANVNFLQLPTTSSPLVPNTPLSSLFSNTPSFTRDGRPSFTPIQNREWAYIIVLRTLVCCF